MQSYKWVRVHCIDMSAKANSSNTDRIEKIAGVPCNEIEREHGSTHLFKDGNECSRCRSRVSFGDMVPLHDENGVKALTCEHCGGELIKITRD